MFNYIPEDKRYGKTNLEELEKFTTDSIKKEIQQIASEIGDVNQRITFLEKKETESYKAQIESSLAQRRIDLEAHKQIEPPIISPPTDIENLQKTSEVNENIDNKKKQVGELEKLLSENKQEQNEVSLAKINLEKVLTSLTLLENEFSKTKEIITPTLTSNNITVEEVISLIIKREAVKAKLAEKSTKLEELNNVLNPELTGSIPLQILELRKRLIELQNTLDESSKAYQKYLNDKEAWTRVEKEIIGSGGQLGSIKYFEHELTYISSTLVENLSAEIDKRKELLKKLFAKKMDILNSFKTFYQPITDFFSKNGDI